MKKIFLFISLSVSNLLLSGQGTNQCISPDKTITAQLDIQNGQIFYTIKKDNEPVIRSSRLGIDCSDQSFADGMTLISVSKAAGVKDKYQMKNAKKSEITYTGNETIFTLRNSKGNQLQIIFRASNDGFAFRYFFPAVKTLTTITKEYSSFSFDPSTRAWLQPMSVAKSGWEQCNPAYEEHYYKDVPVGTVSKLKSGWVYPALFKTNNNWVLITEAGMDGSYCGTKLINDSAAAVYSTGFPDPREVFTGQGSLPVNNKPWYSPWRILTIGSLGTIATSTLGTDLAAKAIKMDNDFIKPGKASWSWINSKDNFITYDEQKKYIDFASKMKWEYCLIDADWDTKIGYDKITELANYGKTKKVGLILWYNSAGDWNTVKYHPKGLLLTKPGREKEFSRLQAMGIKGVKIDFFGGDGQSMMQYYIDILEDAARYKLLVNFHGATLPRGWQRTYPNLMSAEAVHGMEMVTFGQAAADEQPSHCTVLPFTRNAFDPMDFTPMNLTGLTHSKSIRRTSPTFELALSVLFLSGIQHYAQNPEQMDKVPAFVTSFLQELPGSWDDVQFIDGYPGKYIVLARKSGNRWYIAGINAEKEEKKINIDLVPFKKGSGRLITDTDGEGLFRELPLFTSARMAVKIKPNGGFVAILE